MSELDWSTFSEFDEIFLIVCRPIQREIDNLKNKGNDRVGRRARATSSLFRELIKSRQKYKLIREANPQAKLSIKPACRASPSLKNQLDYSKTDDELVGCVYSIIEQNSDIDVRLLTHDSGPMGTADMLNIPFIPIPDEWIRLPEKSQVEQENQRLRDELARFKKFEPDFEIVFVNSEREEMDSLEFEHVEYTPLTNNEISELMDSLKKNFPMATEFGSLERTERKSQDLFSNLLNMREVYTPASDQEISNYTNTTYPGWLEKCEKILRHLHISLKEKLQPIEFIVSVVNKGTRPGENALITISANGNFKIRPPKVEELDESSGVQNVSNSMRLLPLPPMPPKGKWSTLHFGISGLSQIGSNLGVDPISNRPLIFDNLRNERRDPNEFYYKFNRSIEPTDSFHLECDQWRHDGISKLVEGELCIDQQNQVISGVIECSIQAANVSTPVKKAISVRGKVTYVRVYEMANTMLKKLKWTGEQGKDKNILQSS